MVRPDFGAGIETARMKARLIFLGNAEVAPPNRRVISPDNLKTGDALPVELKQNAPWPGTDVSCVILGSKRARADVLVVDEPLSIGGEHVRFYLNHVHPPSSHLRPMKNSPVKINGIPQNQFEWIHPKNGDE